MDFARQWGLIDLLHIPWAPADIAGMGWFSSDRAIRGYADAIWDAPV